MFLLDEKINGQILFRQEPIKPENKQESLKWCNLPSIDGNKYTPANMWRWCVAVILSLQSECPSD